MSYCLTLTASERKAIDWVGTRYATGWDLYHCLFVQSKQSPEVDWDDDGEITFTIPEHVAWKIADLHEQEDSSWPCYADEFCAKLDALLDSIV